MPEPAISATGTDLPVTALSAVDLDEIIELDAAAFGEDAPRDFFDELIVPWLDLDRFIGARDPADGNQLVAQACILSKQMTFPGGAVHPVAGVSWVAVRPGWRRRGLLRGLMTNQLQGLHDTGAEPVAILTASEASLYGRFGYGQAIDRAKFSLSHGAAFRPGVPTDQVQTVNAVRAHTVIPALYARIAGLRPGNLARSDAVWTMRFSDHEILRRNASKKRYALHPDGFVAYRITSEWADRGPNFALQVDEICAATPKAFASLWRFLLDLDLTKEISYGSGWLDDPVQDLLVDPRTLTITRRDHVWLRVVDLARAIGLRPYSAELRVSVEVTDAFCPWNQGNWLFELGADGGRVTRTEANPQIRLDIRDLGGCLVGGSPLGRLVTAGHVTGQPEELLALGAALSTPVQPWCPEGF